MTILLTPSRQLVARMGLWVSRGARTAPQPAFPLNIPSQPLRRSATGRLRVFGGPSISAGSVMLYRVD